MLYVGEPLSVCVCVCVGHAHVRTKVLIAFEARNHLPQAKLLYAYVHT